MNSEQETKLEAFVDRELKALSVLPAPPALAPRILAQIATRAQAPWYCRSWQTWPPGLRTGALALLTALFASLCYGGWYLVQADTYVAAAGRLSGAFSVFELAIRTLGVLGNVALQVLQLAGPGLLVGVALLILTTYVLCLGLGSACVRFAWVRRGNI